MSKFGRLDILVSNAAVNPTFGKTLDVSFVVVVVVVVVVVGVGVVCCLLLFFVCVPSKKFGAF